MATDDDDDDLLLFASLGGSLMKDLLADLQVHEDDQEWLNLEQLEQELAYLDLNHPSPAPPSSSAAAPTSEQTNTTSALGGGLLLPSTITTTTTSASAALNPFSVLPPPPQPPSTAASFLVQQQQQQQSQRPSTLAETTTTSFSATPPPQDAWSLQLQQFALGDAGQDFLKADQARKQQQQQQKSSAPTKPPPGLDLSRAEDYDVGETVQVTLTTTTQPPPPPGIVDPQQAVLAEAATKLVQQLQQGLQQPPPPQFMVAATTTTPPIPPRGGPPTPHNSVALSASKGGDNNAELSPPFKSIPRPPPPTPQTSLSIPNTAARQAPPPQQQQQDVKDQQQQNRTAAVPTTATGAAVPPLAAVPIAVPMMATTAAAGIPPLQQQQSTGNRSGGGGGGGGSAPPQHHHHQQQQQVMATRGAGVPPQQQQAQRSPPPVLPRVYCNPHPRAQPIPATALESRYMKSRDINYVVHGILRPVLALQPSVDDYHVQFFLRQEQQLQLQQQQSTATAGGDKLAAGLGGKKTEQEINSEMQNRLVKAKQWSNQNAVLGHVAKNNVARPRALIALPHQNEDGSGDGNGNNPDDAAGMEQRQRAALWRARIYCDQAYHALDQVVRTWRRAAPGQGVPPALQTHLVKLLKCLGLKGASAITIAAPLTPTHAGGDGASSQEYTVDMAALKLLLKLNKGRILVARVLEQALLPARAVHALTPALLEVVCPHAPAETAIDAVAADHRLFSALTWVTQSLVYFPGTHLLQSLHVVQKYSTALSTTWRMQCVHALLQRGGHLASTAQEDPVFVAQWKETEEAFLLMLATLQ